MILTLQSRSTITVPHELRERLGIGPGDPLEATVDKGRLVLTPVSVVPRVVSLTEKGRKKEAEADKDVKAGRVKRFAGVKDLLKDLDEG